MKISSSFFLIFFPFYVSGKADKCVFFSGLSGGTI